MNPQHHSERDPMQALAKLAVSAEHRARIIEADREAYRARLRELDPALFGLMTQLKRRFGDVAIRRYWCPLP